MENKYLVVIPYCAREAQGLELEFAVAGWRKHFKEKHTIVIVGDLHPIIYSGSDICYLAHARVPEDKKNYRPHLDLVSKFREVHKYFPDSKGFIFTCDDFYAINDFTFEDVNVLKFIPGGIDFDPLSPNPWRRDAMKTKRALQREGLPDRNFTTHLPQWYDWDKFEALCKKYDMTHNSYVIEDLYFNTYFPVAGGVAIDGDDKYKCSVTSTHPDIERLNRALSDKIWINNNTVGYTKVLEDFLLRVL